MKDRGLFMGLEGTIIRTLDKKHPLQKDNWEFLPAVLEVIASYYRKGYKLFIVSNENGLSQGLVKPKELAEKISEIVENITLYILADKAVERLRTDAVVSKVFVSPNENHKYQLPLPTAAFEAKAEGDLDLEDSIMLGSTPLDKQFAEAAGMKFKDIGSTDAIRTLNSEIMEVISTKDEA